MSSQFLHLSSKKGVRKYGMQRRYLSVYCDRLLFRREYLPDTAVLRGDSRRVD